MHVAAQKYQNIMPSMDNSAAWSAFLVVIMSFLYFSILMYGVHENLSIRYKVAQQSSNRLFSTSNNC